MWSLRWLQLSYFAESYISENREKKDLIFFFPTKVVKKKKIWFKTNKTLNISKQTKVRPEFHRMPINTADK